MSILPALLVALLLGSPSFSLAQDAALEAEVRAAITQSAVEQGLTSAEIDALVGALSIEAEAQAVRAEDVAFAQTALAAQEIINRSPGEAVSATEEVSPLAPTALSLVLIVLAALVLWLWRKMWHGGALGPVESA